VEAELLFGVEKEVQDLVAVVPLVVYITIGVVVVQEPQRNQMITATIKTQEQLH